MNGGKRNGTFLITLFAILMLLYQGWRVFDYMSTSLTGVGETTKFLVAAAFLTFSELGIITWLHIGRQRATTEAQETTAEFLIWIDFGGSMLVGLGDLLKHNTFYNIDFTFIDPVLFLAPWIMVVANIAGYLIYFMSDAQLEMERAERQLEHEENQLEIETRRTAVSEAQRNRAQMAAKLSPMLFKDMRKRISARTSSRYEGQPNELLLEDVVNYLNDMNGRTHNNGKTSNLPARTDDQNPT